MSFRCRLFFVASLTNAGERSSCAMTCSLARAERFRCIFSGFFTELETTGFGRQHGFAARALETRAGKRVNPKKDK